MVPLVCVPAQDSPAGLLDHIGFFCYIKLHVLHWVDSMRFYGEICDILLYYIQDVLFISI